MRRRRNTTLWVSVIVVATVLVALLPALVAYRYTSPDQRNEFVSHPWRGWSFVVAALRVPGDSRLKTSGEALRKADWLFKRSAVEPHEVQLLFVASDTPHDFSQEVAGVSASAQVTPSYRFIWEVRGTVPTVADARSGRERAVVALLDYETGRLLYDIRDYLPAEWLEPPVSTPAPAPSEP